MGSLNPGINYGISHLSTCDLSSPIMGSLNSGISHLNIRGLSIMGSLVSQLWDLSIMGALISQLWDLPPKKLIGCEISVKFAFCEVIFPLRFFQYVFCRLICFPSWCRPIKRNGALHPQSRSAYEVACVACLEPWRPCVKSCFKSCFNSFFKSC